MHEKPVPALLLHSGLRRIRGNFNVLEMPADDARWGSVVIDVVLRFLHPWFAVLALGPTAILADPWLAPGDSGLRHDIQVLADRNVLRGPVMSWPLSWADIA